MSSANDPIIDEPETGGSQSSLEEQPGAEKGPPGSPSSPHRVGFLDVELEEIRRLSAIDEGSEEDDEEAPLLEDLSRRESVLAHALRRSSGVPQAPEPRRFSINERRRGSWGQGVFVKPEPERRRSIVVQELRRRSSTLPPVEEEEGKPGPRRESIVVQEVRRRSTVPKVEVEEPARSPTATRVKWGEDVEDKERVSSSFSPASPLVLFWWKQFYRTSSRGAHDVIIRLDFLLRSRMR
jgi:hypothetical protein